MNNQNKIKKLVIDESISASMSARFEAYAKKKNIRIIEHLSIASEHQGMPDDQILHHLLDKTTALLTTDRPFHNKVLARGLRSFYINEKSITAKKLPGIRIRENDILSKDDLEIKDSYHKPQSDIRYLLLPSNPKSLKKLQTKRRRIRNRFAGQSHIDQVAITVSWCLRKSSTLIGIRIRVSSNVGLKAFDASESYIVDEIPPEDRSLVSLCYAMILSIQLMLNSEQTLIYYDSLKIVNPIEKCANPENRFFTLFEKLSQCLTQLEFIPSPKGKYIERLRSKLGDLAKTRTNEIVSGNILEILRKCS